MKWLRVLVVMFVAALVLAPMTGCGTSDEKAGEQPARVEVDKDGNKVTVTGEEGEKAELQGGEDLTLPDGFPNDVPVYKNAQITTSSKVTSGGKTLSTVGFETSDDVEEVHAWYKAELPKEGWTIEGEAVSSAGGETTGGIGAKKGGTELSVALGRSEGDPKTTISLIVSK